MQISGFGLAPIAVTQIKIEEKAETSA